MTPTPPWQPRPRRAAPCWLRRWTSPPSVASRCSPIPPARPSPSSSPRQPRADRRPTRHRVGRRPRCCYSRARTAPSRGGGMEGARMGTVEQDLVDAINDLYGAHPHTRAAHAKGTYCAATFTASPGAAQLSRAAHLRGDPVSALVRFSNGSGDPHGHDGAADGRGMAVKFDLGGGAQTDIVALSLP